MSFIWRKHVHCFGQYPWKLLGIADPRLETEAKGALIAEFEARAECCLPHGLARTMKASGLDLRDARTTQFLYWYAFMVRMTVADVEVRHARNNATSSAAGMACDFSNIVAQYVVAEFSELRRAGVIMGARGCQSQLDAPGDAVGTPDKKRSHAVVEGVLLARSVGRQQSSASRKTTI